MDYCWASFTGIVTKVFPKETGVWFVLRVPDYDHYHATAYGSLPAYYPHNLATCSLERGDKIICGGRLRRYASQFNNTADRATSLILLCEEIQKIKKIQLPEESDPPKLGGLRTESGGHGQQKERSSDAHNIDAEWNPFNPDLTWWGDR